MPHAQGAVLVLPFPYSDRLAEKRRPAVVVSKPLLERAHGLLWVAMITSDHGNLIDGDVRISNLRKAGLPVASLVRPTKLATVEPSRVLRAAGSLARDDLHDVLEYIRNHF